MMSRRLGDLDGTAAETKNERLLDVIFGIEGACERCLPRRNSAIYELWETIKDPSFLEADVGPYTSRSFLCVACTAEVRSDKDPDFEVAMVRSIRQ